EVVERTIARVEGEAGQLHGDDQHPVAREGSQVAVGGGDGGGAARAAELSDGKPDHVGSQPDLGREAYVERGDHVAGAGNGDHEVDLTWRRSGRFERPAGRQPREAWRVVRVT